MKRQKTRWIIDAVLFAGLVICFLLDITGLSVHQCLGIAVGLLAGYHLLMHSTWVKQVTLRFFRHTSRQARIFYAVDAAVMLGLLATLTTGMAVSTWLSIPLLSHYHVWKNIHVIAAVSTLLLVVLKTGLHWRWIIAVARRHIFIHAVPADNAASPQSAVVSSGTNRREFLKLMTVVGAASAVGLFFALDSIGTALSSESVSPESSRNSGEEATAESEDETLSSSSNVAQCRRACSYPGHCRLYVDTNGNRYCDHGEAA